MQLVLLQNLAIQILSLLLGVLVLNTIGRTLNSRLLTVMLVRTLLVKEHGAFFALVLVFLTNILILSFSQFSALNMLRVHQLLHLMILRNLRDLATRTTAGNSTVCVLTSTLNLCSMHGKSCFTLL